MMSFMNKVRASVHGKVALVLAGAAVVVVAIAAVAIASSGDSSDSSSGAQTSAGVGQPPPEWAANAGAWPAHNHDLANTRATTQTPINSQNVSQLKQKWTFPLKGGGAFGAFSSSPIVLNGTVYFQDLSSNVFALDRSTGKLKWQHTFNKPSVGPNGVAYGNGRIYGATETNAFALDPQTGKTLWTSPKLTRNSNEGIDIAPQLYDGTVLVSTVPGNVNSFYKGNGDGIVWALDNATGKAKWKFNTVSDGAKLWGNPKINSGGGLWYPPAVDSKGRVFIAVANPAPLYGTKKFPDGSSRPGPNLYTNSVVALNGQTGKKLWFQQTVRHDTRDYDLLHAVLATVPIKGVQTEIVMVAGKMGKAFAYRAADGKHLWTRSLGKHQHDTGPLSKNLENIFPGDLGGVETPMAFAANRLFVPWVDLPTRARASGLPGGVAGNSPDFTKGRGGLAALDATTGKIAWQNKLPSMNFGAATVANDVVFTSDYAGNIYGFDTQTGKTLFTTKAPAGINSFPAIDGDTLLVGASTAGFTKNPQLQLIAYSLP